MSTVETITVLMTDLVGSTALSMAVGPAASEELRQEHFALLRGPIPECQGREVKNLGDGLMVVFGSASSAMRCAVAMQQAVERRNRAADRQLAVRIGVSLGEADAQDGDYFGRPVVESARLCAAAQGGQILASELARVMAGERGGLAYEIAGALDLKGLPEPVEACEVLWEPAGGAEAAGMPLPAVLRGMPPAGFVGRDIELPTLESLWGQAVGGQLGVALVSGEPGIGKTRLATHLAMTAHGQGATVLMGRCSQDAAAAFRPWSEALAHLVDHVPEALLCAHVERHGGELLRLVPQLRGRVPQTPDPRTSDPETERYLLFGAVIGLLGAAAEQAAVLLVLDDLHWADPPSVALLRHVVQTAAGTALLVVGTYRDSELSRAHPLSAALADLRRDETVVRVALTGLSEDEILAVMTLAAGHDLDEMGLHLAGELLRETDGNPFFVGEILRSLRESGGVIQKPDGRWTVAAPQTLGLPQSVREVVGQRVERLGDVTARTLGIAAVIGREFDLDLLALVAAVDADELLDQLDTALAAALLVESTGRPGWFTFQHALINHTLYEDLGRARRARLHRRVAEALEQICGDDPGPRIGELARHWAAATTPVDSTRAAGYAVRAGDRALAELAPDDALGWYERACEMLEAQSAPDPALSCDARVGLGEAQRRTGDPQYRETLLGAARLALRIADAPRLAAAVLANSRGRTSVYGQVDSERVELIERAIEHVDPADRATRGRLLSLLSLELAFEPDLPRRKQLADEALALARASGDGRALAHVLRDRSYALWDPRDATDRRRTCDELLALAEALDDPTLRFWALLSDSECAVAMGDTERVGSAARAASALADALGQPTMRWAATYHAGSLLSMNGIEEAERLAAAALEIGMESGEADAMIVFGAQQGITLWMRGDREAVATMFGEAVQAFPGLPAFGSALAALQAERGDLDGAREALEAAKRRDFDSGFIDATTSVLLYHWAYAAVLVGDRVAAARLEELLEPVTDRIVYSGASIFGAVDAVRGTLALMLGRSADGAALIRSGMALNDAIGAPIANAFVLLRWALLLGRAGDAAGAVERYQQARSLAAAHGCTGLVELADNALAMTY